MRGASLSRHLKARPSVEQLEASGVLTKDEQGKLGSTRRHMSACLPARMIDAPPTQVLVWPPSACVCACCVCLSVY